MATYYLIYLTDWTITAPIERVWQEIYNYEQWPTWWKYVKSVTKLNAGEGIERNSRFTWNTALPYQISFDTKLTLVKPPYILELEATGDVEGTGLWQLESVEAGTRIRYTWSVKITQGWMDILSRFIRPLMNWNHDVMMQEGGEALAKRLGAKLISGKKRT